LLNKWLVTIVMSIALLLTSVNTIHANPTGDTVTIDVPEVGVPPTAEVVVGPEIEYEGLFFGNPGFPIMVDIDDGTIVISAPNGPGPFTPFPFPVLIHDLQWRDQSGQIIPGVMTSLDCETISTDPDVGFVVFDFPDPIRIDVFTGDEFNTPFAISCSFEVEHELVLVGGEMINVDPTALILAGGQMTAAWMIPVIVSGIGIGIVIARKF